MFERIVCVCLQVLKFVCLSGLFVSVCKFLSFKFVCLSGLFVFVCKFLSLCV